jgi:hypothetical protein
VKRLLISGALLVGMMGTQVTQAAAMEVYCDSDPPVAIITPAGHLAVVYVDVYSQLPLVALPLESHTVTRTYDAAGNPVTQVDMAVTSPAGLLLQFRTHTVVSTGLLGSGKVLASSYGSTGQTTHLRFTINQP